MDNELLLSFFHSLEKLKNSTRHSWTSNGRHESVAEHCWRLACLIILMKDKLKEYDIGKMLTMALFHDIGEIKHGDVPGFDKTQRDVDRESMALEELSRTFSALGIDEVFDLVRDFDLQKTKEAKVVRALDMLEAVIQHNEADIGTWIDKEYELNSTYGTAECAVDDSIAVLRNLVREHTEEKIRKEDSR